MLGHRQDSLKCRSVQCSAAVVQLKYVMLVHGQSSVSNRSRDHWSWSPQFTVYIDTGALIGVLEPSVYSSSSGALLQPQTAGTLLALLTASAVLYCCTSLNYTALHCTALHCTALHCTALHCTALHHCTAMHCTALHCTALHCTALHCTALNWTAVHCSVVQCTALHFTALYSFTMSDNPHRAIQFRAVQASDDWNQWNPPVFSVHHNGLRSPLGTLEHKLKTLLYSE